MGTSLGPKYIPYTYMDPLGLFLSSNAANAGILHDESPHTLLL